MPRGSTLFLDAERELFGRALADAREAAGLSKRDVARSIAGKGAEENRTRLTRYESGKVIPSPDVVRRLAKALGVPELELLLLAGHFDELLRPIVGCLLCAFAVRERAVKHKHFAPEHWQRFGDLRVPGYSFVAVTLGLWAFPRRGEHVRDFATKWVGSVKGGWAMLSGPLSATFRRLPREFARAKAALHDTALPSDTRRFVAAEWVHAWLQWAEPELYRHLLQEIYVNGGKP